jgi:transposase-like protein
VDALEHRARLDPNRLGRGRSYARRGSVLDLRVDPGVVSATVQGSRVKPYEVTVRIRAFSGDEWDAVLDVVSAQIGRVAALLDGELPPEVVDDAQAAGLELLPDAGEVKTACNCPDFAVPCKHSAAVCFLIANALDEDPFVLLLLRGRGRDELMSALRSRRSARGDAPVVKARPVGVLARAAFAKVSGPLPLPPKPLGQPGVPSAVLMLDPPRRSGVEGRDLVALATDAARRAWELASGDGDGGLGSSRDEDLARRAVGLLGASGLADLAHRAGVPARQLTSWAIAWREGGAGGFAVAISEPVEVDAAALGEGIEALRSAGASRSPRVAVEGNWLTAGRRQLRLGADGLWYLFSKQFNDWVLSGPGAADPVELLGS